MLRFLPLGLAALVAAAACRRDGGVPAEPPSRRPALPRSNDEWRPEIRRGAAVTNDFDQTIRDYEEKLQAHRLKIARLLRDQGDLTNRMTSALGRAEERVMELEAQLDVL